MPLFENPVVMPYRIEGDDAGALYPVQVRAVASAVPAALATTAVLVHAMGQVRHPGRTVVVERERAKAGIVGRQVAGPYAYVFTRGSFIHCLSFPVRIDNQAGEQLSETLSAFKSTEIFGLVMDCAPLTYINTIGLTALSANSDHLHLFRVAPTIARVFEIVGLDRRVRIQPSLTRALAGMIRGDELPTAQQT